MSGPGSLGGDDGIEETPTDLLHEFLEELAESMDLDVEVIVEEHDGVLTGRIEGEEVGPFIGRRGHTIDAIQHLAQRIALQGAETKLRVVIDADGYRERRAEVLREDADDAAEEVLSSGEAVELAPMPASERRVVHEHLRDRGDVRTHSEGDEPDRYLVISPLED